MCVKGGAIDIRAKPERGRRRRKWKMGNARTAMARRHNSTTVTIHYSLVCCVRVDCSIQTFWHVLVRVRFHFSPSLPSLLSLQRKCVKSAIKAVNRVNCKCEMRFTLARFGLGSVRFSLV